MGTSSNNHFGNKAGFDAFYDELPIVGPADQELDRSSGSTISQATLRSLTNRDVVTTTAGPGLDQTRQTMAGAWKQTRGYQIPARTS